MDHPVIHISWNDAVAFCKWGGKGCPQKQSGNMPAELGYRTIFWSLLEIGNNACTMMLPDAKPFLQALVVKV
ncbi:hypothetical protein OS493_025949 [Desmophyllum pertusum]|uniref:Sulfatase-modifying factor enzyme-like domain-containing protein n=1 Tax=Desmophyllum pertusum TaxID=174260 RepID=A0A9X0CJ92_9CNID|nr:hypothetical protein OS493_025949 [Desmophyllum pertusum]